ncbi:MAG: T9SS type A sorting domain-containing protein [Ignavibacteriota bacterium]
MKHFSLFLLVAALFSTVASAQLVEQRVIVPLQFQSFVDTGKKVFLPPDYEISVYFAGTLKRPRFMALGSKNTICVADMGGKQIVALPDENHDGIADSAIVIAPPVDTAHSIAYYNGALYVAQPSKVRKFLDKDGDGFFETEESFITGIGDTGYYNHYTRTILFDTIGKHIYLSVGASCNACREGDPERASILQFNLDGSGRRIYATGLRNALGLAVNPENGKLWAANADRDFLSDEVPPEIITSITDGGFYGWPLAYADKVWDDFSSGAEYRSMLPILASDSLLVNSMNISDIQIPAHITPMGIIFYDDPRTYIQAPPLTAFVAVHGSSPNGKKTAIGYKVMQFVYDKQKLSWSTSDFLRGFLTDSVNYSYWGRPCGIIQDTTGDIFLSSDVGIPAIYRIHLRDQIGVKPATQLSASLCLFPNPVTNSAIISYSISSRQYVTLELIDQLGRIIRTIRSETEDEGARSIPISLTDLTPGMYYLRLHSLNGIRTQKIVLRK